ncbi:hypothetical protein DUNSADRAFT_4699 [Dunaliella salina]|uniref:Secreted protein n=1 Tax=Dunaliella salina TaxID=3046 RepID=A0ABQ7H7I2_DUNSA|nr:hypothetical protein DUNSADRAFT_4699 [Dunaliella salina]|eukprot:KAF5842817.1 hypothetical protein DUNSADRAFT_4699 [Dunaliella salina]
MRGPCSGMCGQWLSTLALNLYFSWALTPLSCACRVRPLWRNVWPKNVKLSIKVVFVFMVPHTMFVMRLLHVAFEVVCVVKNELGNENGLVLLALRHICCASAQGGSASQSPSGTCAAGFYGPPHYV